MVFFISAPDDRKKGVRTSAILRNIRGYSDFCMKQPKNCELLLKIQERNLKNSCLSTPPFLNRQFFVEPVFQPANLSHGYGTEETPLVVLKI